MLRLCKSVLPSRREVSSLTSALGGHLLTRSFGKYVEEEIGHQDDPRRCAAASTFPIAGSSRRLGTCSRLEIPSGAVDSVYADAGGRLNGFITALGARLPRGVIVHDRFAMYWKLKRAKHGICSAHPSRAAEVLP